VNNKLKKKKGIKREEKEALFFLQRGEKLGSVNILTPSASSLSPFLFGCVLTPPSVGSTHLPGQ
jgi:hypothetical protein